MSNINNTTRYTVISGSGNADSIYNYARGVTINANGGNDTIRTYGHSVRADGGDGADSLLTTGGNSVSLHGGTDNDTLTGSSYAEIFQFRSDGGNDVITNYNSNDTVQIISGGYNGYSIVGNDVIINAKGTNYSGTIRLLDASDKPVLVKVNNGAVSTINNDPVVFSHNLTSNTVLSGTNGRDFKFNYANSVRITTGGGNDTIVSYGNNNSVFSGDGNDLIYAIGGEHVTIHGGKGNDTIYGTSNPDVIQFRSDGGNDVIYNFDADDTIQNLAGTYRSFAVKNNDIVVTVKGTSYTGTLTLKDYGDNAFLVRNSNGAVQTVNATNIINNSRNNTVIAPTSGRDIIYNTGEHVTIRNSAGNDTIDSTTDGNVYLFGSDGGHDVVTNFTDNDTLQISAGNIVDHYAIGNDYFVSLRGTSYAGDILLKGAANKLIHTKVGSKLSILNYDYSNFKNNQTMNGTAKNEKFYNVGSYVNINGTLGDNTIQSYGDHVSIRGGTGSVGDSIFGTGNDVTVFSQEGNDTVNIDGERLLYRVGADCDHNLVLNFDADDTIQLTSGSLASHYSVGDDYIISLASARYSGDVTLVGAANVPVHFRAGTNVSVLNFDIVNYLDDVSVNGTNADNRIYNSGDHATIDGGAGNDYISSDGVNIVYLFGADSGNDFVTNFTANDVLRLTDGTVDSYAVKGDDVIITVGKSHITLGGAASIPVQIVDSDGNEDISKIIDSTVKGSYINGTPGKDRIYNSASNVTVNARSGDDIIINKGGTGISIDGASGRDCITGSISNSTLKGGAGADTIDVDGERNTYQFGSGDGYDLVTKFGPNDTLQITDGTIVAHYPVDPLVSDGDYVVSVQGANGSGAITLMGASDLPIHIREANDSIRTLNYDMFNNDDSLLVDGTEENDRMFNSGRNVTIRAGGGDDTLKNRGQYASINGGEGNDSIYGSGRYSTVDGGRGDDTIDFGDELDIVYQFGADGGYDLIKNFAESATLQLVSGEVSTYYAQGDDLIFEIGTDARITLGNGALNPAHILDISNSLLEANPYIYNVASRTSLKGTDGDDVIVSNGDEVTIDADAGNDLISISGSDQIIRVNANGGSDTLTGYDSQDLLDITDNSNVTYAIDGSDAIVILRGAGSSSSIRVTDGAFIPIFVRDINGEESVINFDIFSIDIDDTVVSGTARADRIYTTGNRVLVNANAGNDVVVSSGDNLTIIGGRGDDTVYAEGERKTYQMDAEDGNDVILNFGEYDTLNITSGAIATHTALENGDYAISIRGDDVNASVTLRGVDTLAPIRVRIDDNLRAINYDISNSTDDAIIRGTTRAERIFNAGDHVSVDAGSGNDYIRGMFHNSTVDGGRGNDTVYNETGTGYNVYKFNSDGGRDYIPVFNTTDTLNVTYGSITGYEVIGNDLVVSVNSAQITLGGVADVPVHALDPDGNETLLATYDVYLTGTEGDDLITNANKSVTIAGLGGNDTIRNEASYVSIDGGSGDDYISCSWFYSDATIRGGAGNDTISAAGANVYQMSATDGDDVLTNYTAADTIQILDNSTADYRADGDDYIVELRSGSNVATARLKDAAYTPLNVLVNGTVSVINYDYINYSANTIISGTPLDDRIYNTGSSATISGAEGNDSIYNAAADVSISGGDGDDYIYGKGNRTTLNGGEGNDTVDVEGNYKVYQMGSEGGYDLIKNFSESDTLHITAGNLASHHLEGNDYIISLRGARYEGELTIEGGGRTPIHVRAGDEVRVINYGITNEEDGATVTGSALAERLYNSGKNVYLDGGSGADYFYNVGANTTIVAGQNNDTIVNTGDAVSIMSGDGNDLIRGSGTSSTIEAGIGNDTISLDGSNRVYIFGALDGNDLITNFTKLDTLQISSGNLSTYYSNGDDYVIGLSRSTIEASVTLRGAKNVPVQVMFGDEVRVLNYDLANLESERQVNGTEASERIYNDGAGSTISAGAGNDSIYNAAADVSINGGAGNDLIEGSGDRLTLFGGTGDDTFGLEGDYRVYQIRADGGNDVVMSFNEHDSIQVLGGTARGYISADNKYVLEVSSGSNIGTMTLEETESSAISVADSAGSAMAIEWTAESSALPSGADEYWFASADAGEDELSTILDSTLATERALVGDGLTDIGLRSSDLTASGTESSRKTLTSSIRHRLVR